MFVSRMTCAANLADFRNLARKIVCVGRNYKDHALELKNPLPTKPILFLKGNNSLIVEGEKIRIPSGCTDLHYETELAVVIGKTASKVSKQDAWDYIGGYTLALDMTDRGLQNEMKGQGYPWFLAKSFDTSCPVGSFLDKSKVPDPHKLQLSCTVNGQIKQNESTDKMIFDIPTLIEFTTANVRLDPGDLILTGTPAGVGPCKSGDVIEMKLSDLLKAKFEVE